jgi:DNA-binding NtrC family response regulator
MAALEQHEFPGNVRELENRVQRALLVCRDGRIVPADLGLDGTRQGVPPTSPSSRPPEAFGSDNERRMIEEALLRASGVVSRAASELGLSRQALYRRMERLGIELERRPKA